MLYKIMQKRICVDQGDELHNDSIAVINRKEMLSQLTKQDEFDQIIANVLQNDDVRFESYEMMDALCIPIYPDIKKNEQIKIYIILQPNSLWLISDKSEYIDNKIQEFKKYDNDNWSLEKVLSYFVMNSLNGKGFYIALLQEKSDMLETLISNHKCDEDTSKRIIGLRKRLLQLDHDLGQIRSLLEQSLLNENTLLSAAYLREFQIQYNKANRMYGHVQVLQSYVDEIRGAYQADVTMKLHGTIRIFSVLTTVLLSLILFTNVLGMYFQTAIFESEVVFLLMIVICVALALGIYTYFKKKKWIS